MVVIHLDLIVIHANRTELGVKSSQVHVIILCRNKSIISRRNNDMSYISIVVLSYCRAVVQKCRMNETGKLTSKSVYQPGFTSIKQ